jgi:hypothetical protein
MISLGRSAVAVSESEMKIALNGTTVLGEKVRVASARHEIGEESARNSNPGFV